MERFTSCWNWKSLEELITAKSNSTFYFLIKNIKYIWKVTYHPNWGGYTYYLMVERTNNGIYIQTLPTREKLLEDIKKQLLALWFKDKLDVLWNESWQNYNLNICSYNWDFDNLDSSSYTKNKIKYNGIKKTPLTIINNYQKTRILSQEDIEILKQHDIINWLWGKWGIKIKDLLVPIIRRLKKDYREEYLNKLKLIEGFSYYHDLDYYIWGWEREFFQANLNFCIQVRSVIPSNLFFFILLWILTIRWRKYFQFKNNKH